MSDPTDQGPELREPDLPRTMKVRPKALRPGWTTGACAAAAAKAATVALITGEPQTWTEIALPSGRRVTFATERCELPRPGRAEAVVVKDAGDDPDATHGAHLTATVSWLPAGSGLRLEGGVGVGVVTKPGLGLEVGGPAINPVPRSMIEASVAEALELAPASGPGSGPGPGPDPASDPAAAPPGLSVVISVPEGEVMARKTTNARLGILGGISILGTTGIVRPFSTAAWRASVEQAVSVLAAQAAESSQDPVLVLCTGGRTEKGAMALFPDLPEVSFVEVGDFTGAALRRCVEHGVRRVVFVGMAGKLTKLGSGVLMTHYTRSRVDCSLLGDITLAVGGSSDLAAEVGAANTARHGYELWDAAGLLGLAGAELCRRVAAVLERFAAAECGGAVDAEVVMVGFSGLEVVARS
ncbi:MAG: cobalt-precorrin-5B (C(1))-methyltransferase [Catenulispora sp.]|nr:cobalt-precorrin-5B (C(1))-methyltransferase [Catenulispora sp.]